MSTTLVGGWVVCVSVFFCARKEGLLNAHCHRQQAAVAGGMVGSSSTFSFLRSFFAAAFVVVVVGSLHDVPETDDCGFGELELKIVLGEKPGRVCD